MSRRRCVVAVVAAVVVLAAVPDALALTRKQADAVAIRALQPQARSGDVVLFGLPRALRATQSVAPATSSRLGLTPRKAGLPLLRRRAWLYWLDLRFGAQFQHPSVLLVVDDATGRVLRRSDIAYYPLVDGAKAPFVLDRASYLGRRYRVWSNVPARRRVAAGASPAVRLQVPANAFKDDCVMMIGLWDDRLFRQDFVDMATAMRALGVRTFWASRGVRVGSQRQPRRGNQATPADLAANVGWAIDRDCKDVLIFVSGHGNDPAQLLPPGILVAQGSVLTPGHLDGIVAAHPNVTFKIKINGCYSGRFFTHEALRARPNLLLLETAAGTGEVSYGVREDFDHDVPNPGRSEFVHGNIVGIQAFAASRDEVRAAERAGGSLLARMLERAFDLGAGSDGGRRRGLTSPRIHSKLAAAGNAPPKVGAIESQLQAPRTVYRIDAEDPDGDALTITWSKTGSDCGEFGSPPGNPNVAVWSHPHPTCPDEQLHEAVIRVVVSDGTYVCRAVYGGGSATGNGDPAPPCARERTGGPPPQRNARVTDVVRTPSVTTTFTRWEPRAARRTVTVLRADSSDCGIHVRPPSDE